MRFIRIILSVLVDSRVLIPRSSTYATHTSQTPVMALLCQAVAAVLAVVVEIVDICVPGLVCVQNLFRPVFSCT